MDCHTALIWFRATLSFCEYYHIARLLWFNYSLVRNDGRVVLRYRNLLRGAPPEKFAETYQRIT